MKKKEIEYEQRRGKGYGKIKIGADFYGEYEQVYINLSNFGVEIPDYVQKAIYDSNVHEDYKDNILLNRKMKELLSNYWDLLANKGSYKSLFNTLSWFEWGDILRLREIWKRQSVGKTIYDDRELMSLLENKYDDSLGNFVKTAYFSLYANFYKSSDSYDNEDNPVLEYVALKWGKEDPAFVLCDNPSCADCVRQRAAIQTDMLNKESFKFAASACLAGRYIPEIIENVKRVGINTIELDYIQGKSILSYPVEKLTLFANELATEEIAVSGVRTYVTPVDSQDLLEKLAALNVKRIILPGVTIGDGTVIGAGSVVTKDIPANCVAIGNPCRVIRKINGESNEACMDELDGGMKR